MTEPHITVYTPDSLLINPFVMARDMFRDLVSSRELAWRLAVRDISAQYSRLFRLSLGDYFGRWPIPWSGYS